jgi:hypothetical protein
MNRGGRPRDGGPQARIADALELIRSTLDETLAILQAISASLDTPARDSVDQGLRQLVAAWMREHRRDSRSRRKR